VKKSVLSAADNTWGQWKTALKYQIPLSMNNTYGSFAREFDVDMSENNWNESLNCPNVIAFTAGKYMKTGSNDYYVRMTSINLGDAIGDGTYIPKNTGVLLKAVGGTCPCGFYYQIHESSLATYTGENLMHAVTVDNKTLDLDATNWNFVLSQGTLHKITMDAFAVPVHKSYLQLSKDDYSAVNSANAKVVMLFGDEETTGIFNKINTEDDSEAVYYNMNGIQVNNPTKGIFIYKGKKIIKK
jgi:hypothetical protein